MINKILKRIRKWLKGKEQPQYLAGKK